MVPRPFQRAPEAQANSSAAPSRAHMAAAVADGRGYDEEPMFFRILSEVSVAANSLIFDENNRWKAVTRLWILWF